MLNRLLILTVVVLCCSCDSKNKVTYKDKIESKRKFLEASFLGANSPLLEKDKKSFQGLVYFPVDSNYRIKATIKWDLNCAPIRLVKDSSISSINYPTAHLSFTLNKVEYKLTGFTKSLKDIKEVFIPFYDLTSGKQTYGAGRFLDATLESNEHVVLDFNMAYNPYCAYNPNYICAVPPFENDLKVEILAGEKIPLIDNH